MASQFGRQPFTPAPVAELGEACYLRAPKTYATFRKNCTEEENREIKETRGEGRDAASKKC